MKSVSQVLQFAIIIERSWLPPILETQLFQKLDFLWLRISAKRSICEEVPEARFFGWSAGFLLNKFKFLQVGRRDFAIQDDLQTECGEIDVPRYDQGIQKSDATVRGDVEHVRIQEFENRDAHLLITSTALPSHDPEPVFPFQFLSRGCLDYIQQLLGDQPFKLTKRFLLKNRAHMAPFLPFAFFEKQFPDFAEQRYRRTLIFF